MSLIRELLEYKSVSIVGLEKNTGKTECLNYILNKIKNTALQIAVTSIGVDGESYDQLYQTPKPEITLFENMLFVTSEKHFLEKKLTAKILNVGSQHTALGRLITAKVKTTGKIILSGPSDNGTLQNTLHLMNHYQADITLVDGALSRLSIASPSVTEAMILTTGAALSEHFPTLINKTYFACQLINLEEVIPSIQQLLNPIKQGIWAIDENSQKIYDLNIPTALLINKNIDNLFSHGTTLFVSGAISDTFLNIIRLQKSANKPTLIIRDFSKAFFSENTYRAFIQKGGSIKVLQKPKLIAVCINPVAPSGRNIDSLTLQQALQERLNVPVFDVKRLG
jgi:hypothetical protein